MFRVSIFRCALAVAVATGSALCPVARAAEHITLRNGFELDCERREMSGDRVRLYLMAGASHGAGESANYLEVAASAILRSEPIQNGDLQNGGASAIPAHALSEAAAASLSPTPGEMRELLARAGARHNIDSDLLASVVQAESGGNVRAVSRAGAQGLMQLMPGTASTLGVHDAFVAEENIGGGSAYLDQMLTRYHDNIALALAAYNAGPLAVDRYHGIPPYAETRAYVARVIREFNRRKAAAGLGIQANAN